jgi:opacity protein-like surface antigen
MLKVDNYSIKVILILNRIKFKNIMLNKGKIMKKTLVIISMLSSLVWAGGDIAPVEPEVTVPVVLEEENVGGLYAALGIVYNRTYATDSAWFSAADTQDQSIGISGSLGYEFNKYFAVEGRISKSFYEEDYADVTTYSLFLKPQYPVTNDMKVYALLGYGLVQVDGESSGNGAATPGTNILDESGFQWGLGLSYALSNDLDMFVDYTSLMLDGSINNNLQAGSATTYRDLSVDALTAGMIYHF